MPARAGESIVKRSRIALWLLWTLAAGCMSGAVEPVSSAPVDLSRLDLQGTIEGENIRFELTLHADVRTRGAALEAVRGAVTVTDSTLPRGAELTRAGDAYRIRFDARGEQTARLVFVAAVARAEELRRTTFGLPAATVRHAGIAGDRDDLDIRFPGAVETEPAAPERSIGAPAAAFLPPAGDFTAEWKPKVRKLTGELAAACDAWTLAVARTGALDVDTLFSVRVVQGRLETLDFDLPPTLSVTRVRGADIRAWRIEEGAPAAGDASPGPRRLRVELNRPQDAAYSLCVEGETPWTAFPCTNDFPVVAPRGMLRTSGFLTLAAEGALRLSVSQLSGLTQIEPGAAPAPNGAPKPAAAARALFAWQYANLPMRLQLAAEDIVTAVQADERLVFTAADRDLTLAADLELDIRDAPARELRLETDPAWTVAAVEGAQVADSEVRDQDGARTIRVWFREPVSGRALLKLRLERTLSPGETNAAPPRLRVADARSERGWLALAAEAGTRLEPGEPRELREVLPAALDVRVPGAQRAYRFKSADWSLPLALTPIEAAVRAEVFELVSLGDTAQYGSVVITYAVGAAPVRAFRVTAPDELQNVEFFGRELRGWHREGGEWVVELQDKVSGDYTLLMTYSRPAAYEGGALALGAVRTSGAVGETGWLALSGAASLAVDGEGKRDPAVLPAEGSELPKEYALLIRNPVLRVWRCVGAPHGVEVRVRRTATQPLLDQVTDHLQLTTRLSAEGEAVTMASCFVKNTAQPHLGFRLPEGAQLWSVTVDGQPAQALASADGRVLVPVARRLDPNQPCEVRLAYAEQRRARGGFGLYRLTAPRLDTESVFASWRFELPEGHRALTAGGTFERPAGASAGLRELVRRVAGSYAWLGRHPMVWAVGGDALGLAVLIAWLRGRGRRPGWVAWLGLLALTGALGVALYGMTWSPAPFRGLLASAGTGGMLEFLRPVTAAGGELRVELAVVPGWADWTLAFGRLAAASLFGVWLLRRARRGGRRPGVAVTAFVALLALAACAAAPRLMPATALLVAVGVPAWLIGILLRQAARCGRRHAVEPAAAEPAAPAGTETPAACAELIPPPAEPAEEAKGDSARQGSAALRLLFALAALSSAALADLSQAPAANAPPTQKDAAAPAETPPPADWIVQRVDLTIDAPPAPVPGALRRAATTWQLTFEAEPGEARRILPAFGVLTAWSASMPGVNVTARPDGWYVAAPRRGTVRLTLDALAPFLEDGGAGALPLRLPPNLTNRVRITLPQADREVTSPQAVRLDAREEQGRTVAELVAGPSGALDVAWRPRARDVGAERPEFVCDADTVALLQPGVALFTHRLRLQVTRGEVAAFAVELPEGTSVTAVQAEGLDTWRFDPATRRLETVLRRPVSGAVELVILAQTGRDSLPYAVTVEAPRVDGALWQRGTLALASAEAVQARVDDSGALGAMSLSDVPPETVRLALAPAAGAERAPEWLKRAFRYPAPPARLRVTAERVLPDVRVAEEARLDLSDERTLLATRLTLSIARAGVFEARLDLPADFELDTLTGTDVSHWDDVRDAEGHAARVYFSRLALGERTLNLTLSRAERARAVEAGAPRVTVRGAARHNGTLVVQCERGLRAAAAAREGVSEINPRELTSLPEGALAFRLLRPDWSVRLRVETQPPAVKAEILQRVDVSEGLLQWTAWVAYGVEHAGVKRFRLQAPQPGMALTFSGRDMARVEETDRARGIWEIELGGKVEEAFRLEVRGQASVDHAAPRLAVGQFRALDVDSQKGWIAIFAGGRLRVRPADASAGFYSEDARSLPPAFGAGDLSGAVLCFRTTRPEAALALDVLRHEAAGQLPANVRSVSLTTVAAEDGQAVTSARVDLEPGTLRFLEVRLPAGREVWSATLNDRPLQPRLENGAVMLPLAEAAGARATVELIYTDRVTPSALAGRRLEGPRFNLPLADVTWSLFLPSGRLYGGFGGTLARRADVSPAVAVFTAERYLADNLKQKKINASMAERELEQARELSQAGRQEDALQALEQAVAYSEGQGALNEDARVQYKSLVRQQAVVGFANRRSNLRVEGNAADERDLAQMRGFNGGNFTAAFGQQVEQQLGAKESDALHRLAEKMLEQQSAAEAAAHPIRVTLPEQGRRFVFHRALSTRADAELVLTYREGSGAWTRAAGATGLAAGFWLLLLLGLRAARS